MPGIFVLRCCPIIGFSVNAKTGTLGRSPLCTFFVNHPSVSPRHATLEVRGPKLLVTDLGSRGGTFVNDRPIKSSPLLPGQIIRFGEISFAVDMEDISENDEQDQENEDKIIPSPGFSALHKDDLDAIDRLSKAHRRVFDLLLTGAAEKAMALRLELSHHTVHNHVRAIFESSACTRGLSCWSGACVPSVFNVYCWNPKTEAGPDIIPTILEKTW